MSHRTAHAVRAGLVGLLSVALLTPAPGLAQEPTTPGATGEATASDAATSEDSERPTTSPSESASSSPAQTLSPETASPSPAALPAATERATPEFDARLDRAAAQPDRRAWPLRPRVSQTGDPTPGVRMYGSGWGHGVGMSQYGAYAMARDGRSAADILRYYYRGTTVNDRGNDSDLPRMRVLIESNTKHSFVETTNRAIEWRVCESTSSSAYVSHTQCGQAAGLPVLTQPADTRWEVEPTLDGFAIYRGQGSDRELVRRVDTFRIRIRNDIGGTDTIYRAPKYTGSTGTYRWGFRDLVLGRSFDPAGQPTDSFIDVVADMSFGHYLRGLGEMPSSWDAAALRAQAITGRTYGLTIRSGKSSGGEAGCSCHILATPANQAYVGYEKEQGLFGPNWPNAVGATSGQVLTYQGDLVQTFYSSSHGGRSEAVEDSWAYGSTPVPYLQSIDDPWSTRAPGNDFRSWRASASNRAFANLVGVGRVTRVVVNARTQGGTPRRITVTAGDGREVSFTGGSRKHAGAAVRLDLPLTGELQTAGDPRSGFTRTPSSQIRRFGFLPFVDDDGGTHEYATVFASNAGITLGRTATRFDPGARVTRGEMARFIFNTFDLPQGDPATDGYPDVSPTAAHAEAIYAVSRAGIAEGYADGRFGPSDTVSRGQMATFLARALGLDDVEPDGRFTDVDPGSTHAGTIYALADAGVTDGCTADRFCPGSRVTRGQMTSFLYAAARTRR